MPHSFANTRNVGKRDERKVTREMPKRSLNLEFGSPEMRRVVCRVLPSRDGPGRVITGLADSLAFLISIFWTQFHGEEQGESIVGPA